MQSQFLQPLPIVPKRYLKARDVCSKLKICKSNLYAKVASGALPKPLKLGRTSLWIESEIEHCVEQSRTPEI